MKGKYHKVFQKNILKSNPHKTSSAILNDIHI